MGLFKYLFLWMMGLLLLPAITEAQQADSLLPPKKDSLPITALTQPADSLSSPAKDSLPVTPQANQYQIAMKAILDSGLYLNSKGTPEAFYSKPRVQPDDKNHLFYLLIGVVFFLALLRFIYARYFATLFTVFFNTSLRQGQLTDQLLQAKLPSLLFNLFFIVSGGFFIYLLLEQYGQLPAEGDWWIAIPLCIAILGVIYGVKYLVLSFTGWLTSYQEALGTYTFIVFLINKIIGIILLPVIITMAFAAKPVAQTVAIVALLATGLMLLLRFFKSYGLLQGRIRVGRFHFLLYIIGVEVLPLLLIYKGLVIYLTKK